MKTVLFVPGFREDVNSRDYKSLINVTEDAGYEVKFISILWNRATIDDWIKGFEFEYARYDPNETVLAGFSFGAMIAFSAAAKQNPVELWLFSLSSYFDEDIKSVDMKKNWLKNLGHRQVSVFSKLNYKELALEIQCKVLLFIGQEEVDMWPTMKYRTNESTKHLSNARLTIIPDVGHDVTDKKYIYAISKLI